MGEVLFLGFGAIGITFASQFVDAGYPFQVLCDEDRKKRYAEQEFSVNGRHYQFSFVTPPEVVGVPEWVFIAVKDYQLENALDLLDGLVGPRTGLISLLNGISSEEVIGKRFDIGKTIPAFVAHTDATRRDSAVTFHSGGRVIFGERNGIGSERIQRLQRLFSEAGVEYQVSDDIVRMMWWKFMVNVGINQTGAILGAPYGTFQESTSCRDVAFSAMREVVDLAPYYGVDLTENDIHLAMEMVGGLSPAGKNSMLQDIEAGRQTEVDIFAAEVCRLGVKAGIATPVNRLFFHMLKTLEWQNGIR